jgi:hypothetical protein
VAFLMVADWKAAGTTEGFERPNERKATWFLLTERREALPWAEVRRPEAVVLVSSWTGTVSAAARCGEMASRASANADTSRFIMGGVWIRLLGPSRIVSEREGGPANRREHRISDLTTKNAEIAKLGENLPGFSITNW